MTTEYTPAMAQAAVSAVERACTPISSRLRESILTIEAAIETWDDRLRAAEQDRADLDVALIVSDHVDGDPEDFIGAVPALREHFAALADDETIEPPAPVTIPADETERCRSLFDGEHRCKHTDGHTDGHSPEPHESEELNRFGDSMWGWTDRSNRATRIPETEPVEPPVGTRLRDRDQ